VRFLVLNFLGASLWAVSVAVSGYLFGHVVELVLGKLKRYELTLFVLVALLGAMVWSVHWFRNRQLAGKPIEPKE
jgi:membrane protein DedA with SNARE-associated domain